MITKQNLTLSVAETSYFPDVIPKGELIKVDAATLQSLPESRQKEITYVNDYMTKLTAYAEKQRNDRISTGMAVDDKPIVPKAEPKLD